MTKYGTKAKKEVGKAMHEYKEGKLKTGRVEVIHLDPASEDYTYDLGH